MVSLTILGKPVGPVTPRIAQRFRASAYPTATFAAPATIYGTKGQMVLLTDSHMVLVLDQRDFRVPLGTVQSWDGRTLTNTEGKTTSLVVSDPDDAATLQSLLSASELLATGPSRQPEIASAAVTTGYQHPSVPDPEVLGPVMAGVVMTRDVFSDAGSDLKSVIGGRLKGIETAVDRSWEQAATQLRLRAHAMGAEAVIGLDVSVQTVSDKAQLIRLVGTAIRGKRDSPPED